MIRLHHAARVPSPRAATSRDLAGEKDKARLGATRVYTSIRRLRKSGLQGVLFTRDNGFRLDPSIALKRML